MGKTEPEPVEAPPEPTPPPSPPPPIPAVAREFLPDAAWIEETPIPGQTRGILYVMAALLICLIAWASFSDLDRIVVARGRLIIPTGSLIIQPLETSVIRAIHIQAGQVVRKGDVLGTFDPTFTSADLGQLRNRQQGLAARIARLNAELTNTPFVPTDHEQSLQEERLFRERQNLYHAKMQEYAKTNARMEANLATAQADQKILTKRLDNLKEIVVMYEELLKKNTGSRLKMLENRDAMLSIQKDLDNAFSREEEVQRSMSSNEAERQSFIQDWRQRIATDLVEASNQLDEVNEQLNKAERRRELVAMTAPADAVVLEVAKRSIGSVVREAEPLFTLVPLDAPLEAEVEVESTDIGLLRVGDAARLKLDAFPFQKHGTIEATVRTITEDAFTRQQNSPAAMMQGDAYYLARLVLGEFHLEKVPANTRLLPGMTATAEIVVGKRTVISYFLYPLIRIMDEGLREP